MTSEEIIQRLLDERKITVKEAMIILTDLAKIGVKEVVKKITPDIFPPKKEQSPHDTRVVMYGVMPTITAIYGVEIPNDFSGTYNNDFNLNDLLNDKTGKTNG